MPIETNPTPTGLASDLGLRVWETWRQGRRAWSRGLLLERRQSSRPITAVSSKIFIAKESEFAAKNQKVVLAKLHNYCMEGS